VRLIRVRLVLVDLNPINDIHIYLNPKGVLDNRKPLSKPSQDLLSFVMVSQEIIKINFWSHLSEEKPGKPQKNYRNPSCSQSHRVDQKRSAKILKIYIVNMHKEISLEYSFLSYFSFVICHLRG